MCVCRGGGGGGGVGNWSVFFSCVCLFCACWFVSLSFSSWYQDRVDRKRLVIVALPGLFFLHFLLNTIFILSVQIPSISPYLSENEEKSPFPASV